MLINKQNITVLIPQRNPFVLIDTLEEHTDTFSITTFTPEANHYLVENGELSESGLIENMAQTAAAREGYHFYSQGQPIPIGYIGAINALNIEELPKVNTTIITKITKVSEFQNILLVFAEVFLNKKLIASAKLKLVIK